MVEGERCTASVVWNNETVSCTRLAHDRHANVPFRDHHGRTASGQCIWWAGGIVEVYTDLCGVTHATGDGLLRPEVIATPRNSGDSQTKHVKARRLDRVPLVQPGSDRKWYKVR